LWRSIASQLRWRLLWAGHAISVTGIVRDGEGRVLLLRHRLWPAGRQWGLPTGYARAGETLRQTIAREIREVTGLTIAAGRLVHLRGGHRHSTGIAYEAVCTGGELRLNPLQVLDATWYPSGDLPSGLPDSHRTLITSTPADTT
jgi:ADP-ribose pyrophosphatase YjhB (NUDIX family)